MNNIAEGFGRFNPKEFIQFLNVAQASALEVKSILYVILDIRYISEDKFNELQKLTDDTKNQILGLIKYLRNRPQK